MIIFKVLCCGKLADVLLMPGGGKVPIMWIELVLFLDEPGLDNELRV